jgi:hypothetical protein
VGTPKHYNFIDCSPAVTDQYACTVFGAQGIPLESGRFRLTHGTFDPRNPDEYFAFDGSSIRL